MSQVRQSGSIVGFVAVGVFLVAVLLGGVYLARQQMTIESSEAKPNQVTQEQPKEVEKEKATQGDSDSSEAPASGPEQSEAVVNHPEITVELPQTGETETMGSALGVAMLCGVVIAYIRSRRFAAVLLT